MVEFYERAHCRFATFHSANETDKRMAYQQQGGYGYQNKNTVSVLFEHIFCEEKTEQGRRRFVIRVLCSSSATLATSESDFRVSGWDQTASGWRQRKVTHIFLSRRGVNSQSVFSA